MMSEKCIRYGRSIIILALLVFCASTEAMASNLRDRPGQKDMATVLKLIATNRDKQATKWLDAHYAGAWCDKEHHAQRPTLTEELEYSSERAAIFRFYADIGVFARKLGRFDDASRCMRTSANYAQIGPEGAAVLYEAALLVGSIKLDNLSLFVTGNENEFFSMTREILGERQSGENKDLSPWISDCMESCGNDILSEITCGLQDPFFDELRPLRVQFRMRNTSRKKREEIFRKIQPRLKNYLLLRSFRLAPSPALARQLLRADLISEDVVAEFTASSLRREIPKKNFNSIDEARQAIAAEVIASEPDAAPKLCSVIRELHKDEASKECFGFYYSGDKRDKKKIKGGHIEVVYSRLTEGLTDATCEVDRSAYVYILYTDDTTGRTSMAQLDARVGPSESCGAGGWGDNGIFRTEFIDAERGIFKVWTGYETLLSNRGCGIAPDAMNASISESLCTIGSRAKISCLTRTINRQSLSTSSSPEFTIDKTGRLKMNLREVDRSVWEPFMSLFSVFIGELSNKDLRRVDKEIHETYGIESRGEKERP